MFESKSLFQVSKPQEEVQKDDKSEKVDEVKPTSLFDQKPESA